MSTRQAENPSMKQPITHSKPSTLAPIETNSGVDVSRLETLGTYWNNGIPSLVLAIVTVVLGLYSYFVVQPNLQERYRATVLENLARLEEKELAISFEKRQQTLEETKLCLQRMFLWDNTNSSIRYQLAVVTQTLAELLDAEARRLSTDSRRDSTEHRLVKKLGPSTEKTTEEMVNRAELLAGLASTEKRKAFDAMQSVERMEGPFKKQARLWLVNSELNRRMDFSEEWLQLSIDKIAPLITKNPILTTTIEGSETRDIKTFERDAAVTLSRLYVMQAYCASPTLSIDERLQAAKNASDTVLNVTVDISPNDIIQKSWIAEAKLFSDPLGARDLAWDAAQTYWVHEGPDYQNVEALVAVFRCLAMSGEIYEAESFAGKKTEAMSILDRAYFRSACSSACVRQFIYSGLRETTNKNLNALSTSPSEYRSELNPAGLFDFSFKLSPYSDEALSILDTLTNETEKDQLWSTLRIQLEGSDERGYNNLLAAVRSVTADEKRFHEPLAECVLENAAYGVVAARLATLKYQTKQWTADSATQWLQTISDSNSEIYIAWSARAAIHLENKQYDQAVLCLEYLRSKVPGDEQIREMLDRAKLSRAASLDTSVHDEQNFTSGIKMPL
jgi:hypothetical protein